VPPLNMNSQQAIKVGANRLTALALDGTVIYATDTGLAKSILDATQSVRDYLKLVGLHDYETQGQGHSGKQTVRAHVLTATEDHATEASLYRPETKKGDPRIWFRKLGNHISGGSAICIVAHGGELYVLDAHDDRLWQSANDAQSPLGRLVQAATTFRSTIADELLGMLKAISGRPHRTVRAGDTGVGATLETLLGISANSRPTPDFKGIELKSARHRSGNKSTLFAQVPDWSLSALKASAEIGRVYGRIRNGKPYLNCTMSTKSVNPNGLFLAVLGDEGLLRERYTSFSNLNPRALDTFDEVATWRLDKLRSRLLEKHSETFWISARSEGAGPDEMFTYERVRHTRAPLVHLFHTLIDAGVVTVDHGIDGNEAGPLFRIPASKRDMLFPPARTYDL
jgi:hypothetical protein